VHRTDGTVAYGTVSAYDAERRQFTVASDAGPVVIGLDQLDCVYLARPAAPESRPLTVACADGARLSGSFDRIQGDRLYLESPAAVDSLSLESVSLPLSAVRSMRFSHRVAAPTKVNRETLVLELESGPLHGALAAVTAETSESRLYWQPLGSSTASPLRDGASGRIDFAAKRIPGRPVSSGGDTDKLYLRAGDIYRCEITRSDERGVYFRTGGAAEQQISHEKLKAIELGPQTTRAPLVEDKRKRLLTLPRLLKDDPPTHILCSGSGDYLRGRLLALGAAEVRFEVNGGEREFPRRLIEQIIWLHADELDREGPPPETLKPLAGSVQVVRIDGTRVTFTPREFADGWLSGVSELLGPCRVHVDEESELLFGDRVLRHAAELPYSQWRLASATEPIAARAEASPGGGEDDGVESILIGRAAPEFTLALVDGPRFSLSGERGKVVVLDFWAGWCAPCMQSLPKLAETVAACDPQKVKLVAVNLQQTPEEAADAMRRLKLDISVALDRDGKTAAAYGASSIPYTVVVGPDGKVFRVFIGYSPRSAEQLRKAIETLLMPEAPASE
jgi:peroxiredoxin